MLRRAKMSCSPSFADYRPRTNVVILLDTDLMLRVDCTREGWGKGKKPKP
jgi:hypothetical protein